MISAEDTDPQKIGCEFMFKLANSSRHFIRSSEKEFVSLYRGRRTIFSKLSPVPPQSAMLRFQFRTRRFGQLWIRSNPPTLSRHLFDLHLFCPPKHMLLPRPAFMYEMEAVFQKLSSRIGVLQSQ